MVGRTNAGGNTPLNFRVVGGTTQPSLPRENDIWVNTATAIGAWALSPDAPTSPASGDVWIKTSIASNTPINALKRDNTLILNPVQCRQYQSGAWVDVAAQAYQSGAWVDVRSLTVLYFDNGYLGESGGYQSTAGTLTVGNEIYFSVSQSSPAYVTAVNQIDLTGFSTVKFLCRGGGVTTTMFYVGVGKSRSNFTREVLCNWSSDTEATVDVSDLTGLHYIGLRNQSWSTQNASQSYVKSIILS